jgi:polyisoprenoid-binding protein YceI
MKASLAMALAAAVVASPEPMQEYRIDAGHSEVSFAIGFLGHPVRGRFDDVRGTISYAPDNPSASGITVVIATKSIATGSAHRDEHLRSPDFFDVARYPAIVFRSASVASRGGGFFATGALTMHGITRTVTIPFREARTAYADPHGSNLVFFSGQLRLARKDFGVLGGSKYNDWFDDLRSAAMADTVDIQLDVTGWDPDPTRTTRYDATIQRIENNGMSALLSRLGGVPSDSLRSSLYDIEQLSRVLRARRKTAEAITLLKTVTGRLDGEASSHSALARAYELSGDMKNASEQARRALSIDSLDTRALELLRRSSF